MPKLKISAAARKAILIGGMCSISYLAVYLARNILGTVSPQMIEGCFFTTEQIGTLSSIYFITYAVGQLINGAIGDKIKAKYMISFGLMLAGVLAALFAWQSVFASSSAVLWIMGGICFTVFTAF